MTKSEPSLPELIRAHIGDRSLTQLSRDCQGQPSLSRLHQILNRGIKAFPDPESIKKLSIGLGVAPSEVVKASARSLGLHMSESDLVIPGAADLPPSAKEAVLRLVAEMRHLKSSNKTN